MCRHLSLSLTMFFTVFSNSDYVTQVSGQTSPRLSPPNKVTPITHVSEASLQTLTKKALSVLKSVPTCSHHSVMPVQVSHQNLLLAVTQSVFDGRMDEHSQSKNSHHTERKSENPSCNKDNQTDKVTSHYLRHNGSRTLSSCFLPQSVQSASVFPTMLAAPIHGLHSAARCSYRNTCLPAPFLLLPSRTCWPCERYSAGKC